MHESHAGGVLFEKPTNSANYKIPCTLWNQKVHYCVHIILPVVQILSQFNPVHVPGQYQCFPFQVVSCPQVVLTNLVYTSPVPHTSTCPAHLTPPSLDNSNNI